MLTSDEDDVGARAVGLREQLHSGMDNCADHLLADRNGKVGHVHLRSTGRSQLKSDQVEDKTHTRKILST